MIQPAKKGFRTPTDFMDAANAPAEQVAIDPESGTVTVTIPPQEPQSAPALEPKSNTKDKSPRKPIARIKGGVDAKLNKPPAEAGGASPAPAVAAPWDAASPKVRITFGVRLPESLHMKLVWLSENTINNSMHSIVLDAIESQVAKMLSEHYKG